MLLVAVATEKELKPLRQFVKATDLIETFITGMGPIVAAANLSKFLALRGSSIKGVLNIGVAGAYTKSPISKLDICLAKQEFFGDFGVCMQDEIVDFGPGIAQPGQALLFNTDLTAKIEMSLQANNVEFKKTNFVTVNCCSGTKKRGDYLRDKFAAGCENMEGAAIALVCNTFNIPCAELRCVSNMVEDRNTVNWQLEEAIDNVCRVTEIVLQELV